MKQSTFLIIAGAFAVLGVLVGILFLFRGDEPEPVPGEQGDPFAGLDGGPVTEVPREVVAVSLKDGSSVLIPDPRTLPQEEGHIPEQGYVIGGGFSEPFRIIYYAPVPGGTDRFLIALNQEPLSLARTSAEERLREYTQLTNGQLCALSDIQVWVLRGINEIYEGSNLGLSFCPGSVKLP